MEKAGADRIRIWDWDDLEMRIRCLDASRKSEGI